MPGIEHRPSTFGGKIEGVLRQIVFPRNRQRRRTRDVEGGNVVDHMRVSVGRKEGETVAESFLKAGLESVVAGVRDTGNFADRPIVTIIRLCQGAAGIQPSLIYIVLRRLPRDVNRRIPLDEAR